MEGVGRVSSREHGSRSTGPAVAIVRDLDMPKAAHAALCAGRLEHRLLRRPEAAETFTRLRLADAVGDLATGEVVDVEGMLPKIVPYWHRRYGFDIRSEKPRVGHKCVRKGKTR